MNLRTSISVLVIGAILITPALSGAQSKGKGKGGGVKPNVGGGGGGGGTDNNPNNSANWQIAEFYTGHAIRDTYQGPTLIHEDDYVINGPVSKSGLFVSVGPGQDLLYTYDVNVYALCHVTATWIGVGPSPASCTLQVTTTEKGWAYATAGNAWFAAVGEPGSYTSGPVYSQWNIWMPPNMEYFFDASAYGKINVSTSAGPNGGLGIELSATASGAGYYDPTNLDAGNFGGKIYVDASFVSSP